ncbi:MAG: LysM peptidoglycan-binding domain-containing protein [Agriterribacter sp.]
MKKLFLILYLFVIATRLAAQSSDLVIQSEGGKFYINHTVEAKENLYSIGRLYNISPKEIAPLNGLTTSSGLELGQTLKVPLTNSNFAQQGTAAADEAFVPLYHVVAEKEGLFRIGQNFDKVSANDLKKWNNLSSESISNGQHLVVGFLRVKKSQSTLAVNGIKKIGDPIASLPPLAKQDNVTTTAAPDKTTKPIETVQNNTQGAQAASQDAGMGFFKNLYKQQSSTNQAFRSETGAASIFKSTSGWQDTKYYALMNNIAPGTIVRITNPLNSKIIFAKILGELPPGKENEGLLIRISNAGAAELKVSDKDPKFSAEVSYAKG